MTTPLRLVLCEVPPAPLPGLESLSSFCLKAHRSLQLCRLSYARRFGEPRAFREYNLDGRVPILLVDGEAVADSTEIVSRVDALSGFPLSGNLDRRARAEAYLWEEMADNVLSGFVDAARFLDEENWARTNAAMFSGLSALRRFLLPDRIRDRVRHDLYARDVIRPNLDAWRERLEGTLDRLEARAPVSGFWLGDTPSRADVAIFAQLWSLRTELTPAQSESVGARPRLVSWLCRVDEACGTPGADRRSARRRFEETSVARFAAAFA